jgi:hypothetical protein
MGGAHCIGSQCNDPDVHQLVQQLHGGLTSRAHRICIDTNTLEMQISERAGPIDARTALRLRCVGRHGDQGWTIVGPGPDYDDIGISAVENERSDAVEPSLVARALQHQRQQIGVNATSLTCERGRSNGLTAGDTGQPPFV